MTCVKLTMDFTRPQILPEVSAIRSVQYATVPPSLGGSSVPATYVKTPEAAVHFQIPEYSVAAYTEPSVRIVTLVTPVELVSMLPT